MTACPVLTPRGSPLPKQGWGGGGSEGRSQQKLRSEDPVFQSHRRLLTIYTGGCHVELDSGGTLRRWPDSEGLYTDSPTKYGQDTQTFIVSGLGFLDGGWGSWTGSPPCGARGGGPR